MTRASIGLPAWRRGARWARVALMVALIGVAGCSGSEPIAAPDPDRPRPPETLHPNRSPVAHGGQFLASCGFSHQANDDPIVHRDHEGMSHVHEFFGNTSTDAASTYDSMIDAATTCGDAGDRSAYWVPALYVDDERIEPGRIDAYYRVPIGVDPTTVQPFPDGLEVIAGDQFATQPSPLEVAAWACGNAPAIASAPPRDCTSDRPVQLRLTFPSCWDGERTASPDHVAHMAYPSLERGCAPTHPVALPQLTLTVHYPLSGTYADAEIASGDFATTHGDFLAAWQSERLEAQVSGCLARSVTCGLVGGTLHTGPGAEDAATYNLRPGVR